MYVYDLVGRFLAEERAGAPVFGLMGDGNLAYLSAFAEKYGGRYVGAVLEGGAVSMADGWSRMTGRPGIASVTHGPALTNTLTALTEAVRNHTPLVLLAGDTPAVNEYFQYVDVEGFARSAGAYYERVPGPHLAQRTLAKAFVRAQATGNPVVVDLPEPVLMTETEWTSLPDTHNPRSQAVAPDPDQVEEAVGALMSARRPLILVGRGAVEAGARAAVLDLARAVGAPVITSLEAKDLFLGEPENLGIFGSLASPLGMEHITASDVVLALGASLNNFQTDDYRLLEDTHVIQVDIEPWALGRYGPVRHAIVGDARATAQALLTLVTEAGMTRSSAPEFVRRLAEVPDREAKDTFISHTGDGFVDMREAALVLCEALGPDAQQVSDGGRFNTSVWPHTTVRPERWAYAGRFGSIGLSVATGVGASAARADVPTLVWAGDGGAMQGLIELSTAVRCSLPLVVVVLNDSCYGAEYAKLPQVGASTALSRIEWAPLGDVATGLGARSVRVTTRAELHAAAEAVAASVRILASQRDGEGNARGEGPVKESGLPLLIEVIVDAEKVVY